MWAGALLLVGIGIYVMKREKPMRLWTDVKVSADEITDVKAYNRAIGRMWCLFSIPLWIAGVVELWYPVFAIVFFCLMCTAGIGYCAWSYQKIEKKYRRG